MGASDFLAPSVRWTELEHVIAGELAPLVQAIDRDGLYPAEAMRSLGKAGAYSAHLRTQNVFAQADIAAAVQAMSKIGQTCGSTAFMVWCQDACAWYIEKGHSDALKQTLLPKVANGEILAGTGMSNPMKYFARIETLKLQGKKVAGGYVVNGQLPWVSNLAPDNILGTAFEVEGRPSGDAGRGQEVMAIFHCDWPGVSLKPVPSFLGMEGTGTYALHFENVFVPQDYILADPIGPWLAGIRCGFVLLQVGMGLGIVQSCIDHIDRSNHTLGHVNHFLEDSADQLRVELHDIIERVHAQSDQVLDSSDANFAEVLTTRLMTSELTLRATQSAMLHNGAAGYALASPVQRKLREGYFVAIVTPAIKHLRKELHRIRSAAQQ
jgi:alkylation response protein AidB-like acyl-CoA dehydrogenase